MKNNFEKVIVDYYPENRGLLDLTLAEVYYLTKIDHILGINVILEGFLEDKINDEQFEDNLVLHQHIQEEKDTKVKDLSSNTLIALALVLPSYAEKSPKVKEYADMNYEDLEKKVLKDSKEYTKIHQKELNQGRAHFTDQEKKFREEYADLILTATLRTAKKKALEIDPNLEKML